MRLTFHVGTFTVTIIVRKTRTKKSSHKKTTATPTTK